MKQLNVWTPKGRETCNVTDQHYIFKVIANLRTLVRETSYNLVLLEDTPNISRQSEAFGRAMDLRQQAVDSLRMFDPEAEEFIERTYKPKTFLHS